MELTFDAALSPNGLIGHMAYIFLVTSMLMRRMLWLRVFALAAFLTGISYSVFVLKDPVGTFWESLLAVISLGQLTLMQAENRRVRFLPHESSFVMANFPGFSRRVQRQILNLGSWERLPAGTVLAREQELVADLFHLAEGEVSVMLNGARLATRGPGALVGELTVATGAPANATVVTEGATLVWRAPAEVVRRTLQSRPEHAAALQAAFFRSVSAKLTEASHAKAQTEISELA
jgi:CRP-like cAMP-binding protein